MPKAEKRGKYAGVKVHLDGPECKALLVWLEHRSKHGETVAINTEAVKFAKTIAKTIRDLRAEFPKLLEDRTEEEVVEALKKDQAKIVEQLGSIKNGKNWKEVK